MVKIHRHFKKSNAYYEQHTYSVPQSYLFGIYKMDIIIQISNVRLFIQLQYYTAVVESNYGYVDYLSNIKTALLLLRVFMAMLIIYLITILHFCVAESNYGYVD